MACLICLCWSAVYCSTWEVSCYYYSYCSLIYLISNELSLSLSLSLLSLSLSSLSLSPSLSSSSSRITGSTSQGKDNSITTFLHSLGRYLCYVKRCVLNDVHVHTLRVSVCCTYCINGNMNRFSLVCFMAGMMSIVALFTTQ